MTKRRDNVRIAADSPITEKWREREKKDSTEENDTNTINETQLVDMDTIITLPTKNAIQLAKLIKKRCDHAKNLTVEKYNDEINLNKFFIHVVDSIRNSILKSQDGEMHQLLFLGTNTQDHAYGFICGKSNGGKPYILHYDYTGDDLENGIIAMAVENMQADLNGLRIIKVPQLQAAPDTCNFFQLMLMKYVKPEDIKYYLSKNGEPQKNTHETEYSVIKVEPGELPEKLLSYYQTRKMKDAKNTKGENVGESIWDDLRNKGHIKSEGIAEKKKEKNVKPQNKIKLLNKKVNEDAVSEMYSVISKTKSEIAAECGVKRFFKKLWRKHLKKWWKKIKGFLYGTRFANNNEANKDLNSEKSNKLIK